MPYTIKAAGTYILLSDLICSDPSTPAITIDTTNLTGSVVLNLKGHTIQCTGSGNSSIGVNIVGSFAAYNAFPVTVRNGIFENVLYGVWAGYVNGLVVEGLKVYLSDPHPANGIPTAIVFGSVANSLVQNCLFNGPSDYGWYGIDENLSPGAINTETLPCKILALLSVS